MWEEGIRVKACSVELNKIESVQLQPHSAADFKKLRNPGMAMAVRSVTVGDRASRTPH